MAQAKFPKLPVYSPEVHGNKFEWILRTAAALREKQAAERIADGRRPLLPRRR